MQLTDEQLATWRRDGSIVIPNVFPPESFAPALEAVERNAYGGLTHAEYRTKWEENPAEIQQLYEQTPPMQLLAGPMGGGCPFSHRFAGGR